MKPMSRIQSFWQMGVLRNEKPCSHWTFSSAATRKVTVTGFGVILLCVPTWTYIPRRNGSFAVRDWQHVTHFRANSVYSCDVYRKCCCLHSVLQRGRGRFTARSVPIGLFSGPAKLPWLGGSLPRPLSAC